MAKTAYSPADIVEQLEAEHDAGHIAVVVEAFWPTIKAALLAYDKATNSAKVKPRTSG